MHALKSKRCTNASTVRLRSKWESHCRVGDLFFFFSHSEIGSSSSFPLWKEVVPWNLRLPVFHLASTDEWLRAANWTALYIIHTITILDTWGTFSLVSKRGGVRRSFGTPSTPTNKVEQIYFYSAEIKKELPDFLVNLSKLRKLSKTWNRHKQEKSKLLSLFSLPASHFRWCFAERHH